MHEPIKFQNQGTADADNDPSGEPETAPPGPGVRPKHLDLKKDQALTIHWADGVTSVYPIGLLRKLSPSADARELRKEMDANPLTVLPAGSATDGPLTAVGVEMVGNYAIQITFSDGHSTGIYSWRYLRSIDPAPSTRPDNLAN